MQDNISEEDVLKVLGPPKTVPEKVWRQLYLNPDLSYNDFVGLIFEAIEWIFQEMARGRKTLQGQSEDQLTQHIVTSLKSMTFEASHDEMFGGHCDIKIEGSFAKVWLGEAKKITSGQMTHLMDGYNQLTTRYSSGMPEQSSGALLIYCFAKRVDQIMKNWRAYLEENVEGITFPDSKGEFIDFYSGFPHESTGYPCSVRHMPAVFYHAPKK